jgi:5-methyltetrahydropteroyltriglutamate--homocysteine methyltransferase
MVFAAMRNRWYDTDDAYLAALGRALQVEYETIVSHGFVLQIDAPDLAMERHITWQDKPIGDFVGFVERVIATINDALANVPRDRVRLHACWGNYEGPHDHDIPLEKILALVLKGKPAGILFEAANPRHRHEWAVWRDTRLPDDKVLIPGCISSTSNYVEHPRLIGEQLCRYADIVGRERVIAGADCGFGSFAGYSRVDPAVAYKKLRALAEGAALATDTLWRSKH